MSRSLNESGFCCYRSITTSFILPCCCRRMGTLQLCCDTVSTVMLLSQRQHTSKHYQPKIQYGFHGVAGSGWHLLPSYDESITNYCCRISKCAAAVTGFDRNTESRAGRGCSQGHSQVAPPYHGLTDRHLHHPLPVKDQQRGCSKHCSFCLPRLVILTSWLWQCMASMRLYPNYCRCSSPCPNSNPCL